MSSLGSRVGVSDLARAVQLLQQSLMPAWEKACVFSCIPCLLRTAEIPPSMCAGEGDVLNQLADRNCTPVSKGW